MWTMENTAVTCRRLDVVTMGTDDEDDTGWLCYGDMNRQERGVN